MSAGDRKILTTPYMSKAYLCTSVILIFKIKSEITRVKIEILQFRFKKWPSIIIIKENYNNIIL